ncbi:O-succinylhomoserine sulfhydrylase [Methyloversatilis sp. XJ19-49]|uniref:O-succinylhomoserine sulfhydrylase n=1 Tax=Methyloversatilis sp. XJ19-49 TaxID=2963429 RepID=UPI00211D0D3B|nr:O-succinylhomoserine sulfhydrylase [Methyloversatilis sp. XJ19-49]MCQ9379213.1 O-succinylhomoserine sulfhydrylase [Methyloversatilis sp. XJ19-49]
MSSPEPTPSDRAAFDPDQYDPETLAIRAGIERSQFGEHSEALYLTSSFVFDNAAEAAARFSGATPGNVYARFTNPTVTMMQDRLAALEGAEACVATSSGMSAILSMVMALLRGGDHIIASRSIFGSTQQLFANYFDKFGISTTLVDATDIAAYRAAVRPTTRLFFIETPSNPLTEVIDIAAVAEVAHEAGALLAVDNCFCSPALQKPLELGADIIIHSATKYLDGQGRVLGGAVCGRKAEMDEVLRFLRTAGPTLSPFNAWIILKGLETLAIRMEAQSAKAHELSIWLEKQPWVDRVYYPGLPSHPQHAIAMRQQKSGAAVVAFEVKGGRDEAWKLIDSTRMLSITANLGDTKTTITHPATTTHGRISQEARDASGIKDSLIRLAIGLESVADMQRDLTRWLAV